MKTLYAYIYSHGYSFNETVDDTTSDIIAVDGNIATIRNKAIEDAIEQGAKYVFLIEHGTKVDAKLLDMYIELMLNADVGLVMYGFGKKVNIIKPTQAPNPIVRMMVNDNRDTVIFNRYSCDTIIGIDLTKNQLKFNEKLNILALEEYVQRCAIEKVIPFFGFYQDIDKSWEYVESNCTNIDKNKMEYQKEKKMINDDLGEIKVSNSIDEIINYVRNTQSVEKEWRIL